MSHYQQSYILNRVALAAVCQEVEGSRSTLARLGGGRKAFRRKPRARSAATRVGNTPKQRNKARRDAQRGVPPTPATPTTRKNKYDI